MDKIIEKKKGWCMAFTKKALPWWTGALLAAFVVYLIARPNDKTLRVDRDSVLVNTARRGEFNDYVRVSARVQPMTTIQLSPQEGGIVQTILVEEGSMVKAGQPILILSNDNLDLQILNSEAELAEKENILRNTQIQMEQQKLDVRQNELEYGTQVERLRRAYEQQKALYEDKLIAREEYLKADLYNHRGTLPNNFTTTMPSTKQALKAVNAFKDEYLLDFINIEELDARDEDLNERVLERSIVDNIKRFILTFGQDFIFVGNQYRLEVSGEELFVDLLFFNRELNSLVAVELKSGKFRSSYLGQLSTYLSALDTYVRKPHENPTIGILLCRDMNQSFVEFAIRDYDKPMGVATYRATKDMPERLRNALPDIEELKKLL